MANGGLESGEMLSQLGMAISFEMARTLSAEEIAVFAALFTIIGDELALLALFKYQNNNG